ncbi:MAG TPA: inositol monophosphatase family protein [Oceanipulchritudo sp.]|nr:inositol monophosphatase family protein [Oceanipulchritudo sp.]
MQWQELLNTAEQVAREAGGILKGGASHLREVEFQDPRDVKLRADMESEELIRKRLGAAFPYPVYGEEKGGDESLRTRYEPYWVVDPLDGTYNYLRGSALCAVSIGLMRGETPILGVIYDFNSDTCYSGVVAEGFFINGQPASPQWADKLAQSALATGFPSGMDRSPIRMQAFLERIAPFKKVRMVGSAALALAYVAGGIYDVYFEESIRLWDVAAGLALVQAAGGVIRMKPCGSGKAMAYDVWAGKEAFFAD